MFYISGDICLGFRTQSRLFLACLVTCLRGMDSSDAVECYTYLFRFLHMASNAGLGLLTENLNRLNASRPTPGKDLGPHRLNIGNCPIFTARNEVGARLCFYVSVILFTGGVPGPGGGLLPGGDPPCDGYCCGRYASYWNAFLFVCVDRSLAPFKKHNELVNNKLSFTHSFR